MAIPFTVDISAFYGEPDFREQNSSTIVDRRKTLNLHKELESGKTRDAVPPGLRSSPTPFSLWVNG